MNKTLAESLIKQYPSLYSDGFQFEHGDGWFLLIKELSEKLKDKPITVVQVKEKFGGLRFYIENSGPVSILDLAEVNEAIGDVEGASYSICEMTGEPGKLCRSRGGTWLKVLSEEQAVKLEYEPYVKKLNDGS